MLNILSKTKPWVVASLIAATSSFAQNNGGNCAPKECKPKEVCPKSCWSCQDLVAPMTCAYNAPARIDVRGCWDIYATGSYILWQARQENMELGVFSTQDADIQPFEGASVAPIHMTIIKPDFDYKSGFKVGLGMNFDHDNWDAYSEYTWFHSTTSTSQTTGAGQIILPMRGHPSTHDNANAVATTASSRWKLKMDFLDVSLARSYFQGTKLVMRPFFGARVAWIRQYTRYSYTNPAGLPSGQSQSAVVTDNTNYSSTSWGIGPRLGFESNWMLGKCFRLIGNASADVLYTDYNLRSRQQQVSASIPTANWVVSENDVAYLRAHTDLEMGFGWGSYFNNNGWHMDISATYGFQVFWDQNMQRYFVDEVAAATSILPNGNLYVHGLTLTARFDF